MVGGFFGVLAISLVTAGRFDPRCSGSTANARSGRNHGQSLRKVAVGGERDDECAYRAILTI